MRRKFFIYFSIALAFLLFFVSCQKLKASSKIKITASVFPLMEFAKAVAGERGEVSLLLPPGAEVHTWQPRASDIMRLSSSDIFIYIGSALEPWLHDLLKSVANPKLRTFEASQSLFLIYKKESDHDQNGGKTDYRSRQDGEAKIFDPHVWLDFGNDQIIADEICRILSEIDPSNASLFTKNVVQFKEKLQDLDRKFRDSLQSCFQRTFILAGHEAFGYLAKRYDLQQITLSGLSPDSQPTPRHFVEVIRLAKKYKTKAIYFEANQSNKLARVAAKEIKAKILSLNGGANVTKKQLKSGTTFFDIMEENLKNLKNGLTCN